MPQRARILSCPFDDALRFVCRKKYLPALTSAYQASAPQAACDGLEFVSILPGKSDNPRPMASREPRIRRAQSEAPCISDRSAGVPEEVMKVAEVIPPKRRAAVF